MKGNQGSTISSLIPLAGDMRSPVTSWLSGDSQAPRHKGTISSSIS